MMAAVLTSRLKRAAGPALKLWLAWLVLALLTVLPARVGALSFARRMGYSPREYLFLTLQADAAFGLPLFVVLFVGGMALGAMTLGSAWRGAGSSSKRADFSLNVLFCVLPLQLLLLLINIAACEFYVQRGMYPTWYDFKQSLSADFLSAEWHTFFLNRYLYPALCCLMLSAAWYGWFWRRLPRLQAALRGPGVLLLILLTTATALGFHHAFSWMRPWIKTIDSVESVRMPLIRFGRALGRDRHQIGFGLASFIRALPMSSGEEASGSEVLKGAQILGLGADSWDEAAWRRRLKFTDLARPLDLPVEAVSTDQSLSPFVLQSAELQQRFAEVAQAFASPHAPVQVWHVVVESLGADDVAAINPAADPRITPFLNELYSQSRSQAPSVIAAPRYMQAGPRTSYAISALMCGLGTMPFVLSVSREFSTMPLRCLPDILSDAGFEMRMVYGSNMAFDNMRVFFRAHQLRHFVDTQAIPKGSAEGVWGYSDRVMLGAALDVGLKEEAAARSRYTFILTLSGHHPFRPAQDMPPELASQIQSISQAHGFDEDTSRRLATVAYTDSALREFVARLKASSPQAQTWVIISGDHTSGMAAPWSHYDTAALHKRLSRTPFVILTPEWFAPANNPDNNPGNGPESQSPQIQAVGRLNEALTRITLSQNDFPHQLLALLSRSAPLMALPKSKRFHTMGAQGWLSPLALQRRIQQTPPVFGVNTLSMWVGLNEKDEVTGLEPQSALLALSPQEITHSPSILKPALTFWRELLRH